MMKYFTAFILLSGFSLLPSFASANLSTDEYNDAWGEYVWGEGSNVIRPCGQTLIYWVETNDGLQKRLIDEYMKLSSKAYMPIYIKFRGTASTQELDGFASEYNRLMTISEVTQVQGAEPNVCIDKNPH